MLKDRRIRVLVAPSAGETNPYQTLLVSSLQAEGIEVILAKGFFFPWGTMFTRGFPDLVHLQWQHVYFRSKWLGEAILRTCLFFIQFLILRLARVGFVWTVHNIVNHEKLHVRWELRACRLLARSVDKIIVHCSAARRSVVSHYRVMEDRIAIVPHGHYIGWYPPPLAKASGRARVDLPGDALVLVFFGQIRKYKGLDRLIEEFRRLEDSDLRLVIAGDPRPGTLGNNLAASAEGDPRIRFELGFVDDGRLVEYLSAADLVVLPYRDSLTSGSAVLAASYGRAVLMPRIGCAEELPDTMGIFYDPDEPDALRCALEAARQSPLEQMGLAARIYMEKFSWSDAGAATAGIYRAVCDR